MIRILPLLFLQIFFLLASCKSDPKPIEKLRGPVEPEIDKYDNLVDWAIYRGDKKANQYSELDQINAQNVHQLEKAWEYHTGEIATSNKSLNAFEDEPSLIEGNLVVCTTSRRLIALDPKTG